MDAIFELTQFHLNMLKEYKKDAKANADAIAVTKSNLSRLTNVLIDHYYA